MGDMGCCGHVNFIAKGDQQNSEEELFFAELRADDGYMTYETTCVVSLEGMQSVCQTYIINFKSFSSYESHIVSNSSLLFSGGLRGTRYDILDLTVKGLRIDGQHCYACSPRIKHPKDGSLYKSGHVAYSDYYFV